MGEAKSESVRVAHKRFTVENDSHRVKKHPPAVDEAPLVASARGCVGARIAPERVRGELVVACGNADATRERVACSRVCAHLLAPVAHGSSVRSAATHLLLTGNARSLACFQTKQASLATHATQRTR